MTPIGMADEIEDVVHILGDLRISGEQGEIGVDAGGLLIEVAGTDVRVAPQLAAFLAPDQHQLGVYLQPRNAEDDVHPGLGEPFCPVDVCGLVEACTQLDDRQHLLAVQCGTDQ